MNHPVMRYLGLVSWLVTSLIAINFGMIEFGYNFFQSPFAMNNLMPYVSIINYIVLGSGVASLALLAMAMMNHCGCGGGCKCK